MEAYRTRHPEWNPIGLSKEGKDEGGALSFPRFTVYEIWDSFSWPIQSFQRFRTLGIRVS
jgi:hypothetical protein